MDSEKYEVKFRDYDAPGNISADVRRLNEIRRSERALQRADNLTLVPSENDAVFAYLKSGAAAPAGERGADLLVAVNLDPHHTQATMVHVPIGQLGIGHEESYVVHDLLTGARYHWRGSRNYVLLDPARQAGHLFRIER
jgi:starch synthase (maltosyl-transferring)